MNLYLISQTANTDYDTYDAAVVCAPNEEAAKQIVPSPEVPGAWAAPQQVSAKLIGKAARDIAPGVVLSSFNAG